MFQHKQNYAKCNDYKCATNEGTKDSDGYPVSLKKIIHFDS